MLIEIDVLTLSDSVKDFLNLCLEQIWLWSQFIVIFSVASSHFQQSGKLSLLDWTLLVLNFNSPWVPCCPTFFSHFLLFKFEELLKANMLDVIPNVFIKYSSLSLHMDSKFCLIFSLAFLLCDVEKIPCWNLNHSETINFLNCQEDFRFLPILLSFHVLKIVTSLVKCLYLQFCPFLRQ